ncbi:hypothetical protein R1flu_000016 [Riccia fluitans]|uniref:Uncharacterized protein n=1 Tax=Riccia fluitans TaxID=41844 RepID=A0ABD1XZ93_9MARC
MEASCAPRSDAERLRKLVRRSTRGAGRRGLPRRDKSRPSWPAYAVGEAEDTFFWWKRAPPSGGGPLRGRLRARDVGAVGFSSDPS